MPIYSFSCSCKAEGIITVNKECEYIPCPFCHKSLNDTDLIPNSTDLNRLK